MRRRRLVRLVTRCLLAGAAMLLVPPSLDDVTAASAFGLITGGERGTYYQFGQDLKRLLKPNGINLTVHPSKGAVDNVQVVAQRPDVQLAIVQSDVLTFVSDQQSIPPIGRIAQGLRLLFPLYDEDVHVLARRELATLDALAGKRVAIGLEGSGTSFTARLLFRLADIVPGEMVALDSAAALAQLKAGRIDAMVAVLAQPVGRFRTDVKPEDALALIPITSPAILERYAAAEIPAVTYPWQSTAVSTVAATAVLVAYDVDRRGCEDIGRLAQHVAAGMDWLAKNGHPYWQRVDLERPVAGWQQYDCVRKYVGKPAKDGNPSASAAERNPIVDAINEALEKNR
jgi:hypothetical protein